MVNVTRVYNTYNFGYTFFPSSSSQGTYLEKIVLRLAFSSNSFKIDFEKNLTKLSEQTVNLTGGMECDIKIIKASISELGDKINELVTHVS